MVPDACGLSRATRALFRSHRHKPNEYSGEAMNYQVLEEGTALSIGAAIPPKSKITGESGVVLSQSGRVMALSRPSCVKLAKHLRRIVPGIVRGLQPIAKR